MAKPMPAVDPVKTATLSDLWTGEHAALATAGTSSDKCKPPD